MRASYLWKCIMLFSVALSAHAYSNEIKQFKSLGSRGELSSLSILDANITSLLDTIKARGYLRVGTTGDYKPFTYKVTNSSLLPNATSINTTYVGADITMAQSLSNALSLSSPPVFISSIWANLTTDLAASKFDVGMGGISITLPRAQAAFYSTPILRVGKMACIRCTDSAKYTSLSTLDVPGVKIAVNPGGTNQAFDLANFHQAEIVTVPDNNAVYQAVVDGGADAMVSDVIEVELQVRLHEGVLCAVGNMGSPWTFEELGYLLPRGDVVWKEFVDHWVRIQVGSGGWNRTLEEWMSYEWPIV